MVEVGIMKIVKIPIDGGNLWKRIVDGKRVVVQDNNNDPRWPKLEKEIDAGNYEIELEKDTAEYKADALETTKHNEREWRNGELARMDGEYNRRRRQGGDLAEVDTYAEKLCDWPDTPDFPNTRPEPIET